MQLAMKYLDWTLPTPEENVAADEALLDWCEERAEVEVLRFWEATRLFVVVGYANDVGREVNVAACKASGIPILRRCSGGGTVLQGPGCLNYTLVLRIDPAGSTRNIFTTNRFVMERNAQAFEALLERPNTLIQVQGHTDLTLDGLKFSGNAQRRKRHCLLFHGTFLLDLELPLVESFLRMPSRQPEYRANRSHRDFIRNLPLPVSAVKDALRSAWGADEEPRAPPLHAVETLVRKKYGRREWNMRTVGRK